LGIAETILHAALTESCAQAQLRGKYSAFDDSPAARGELPFDLWLKNQQLIGGFNAIPFSGRYDWSELKNNIMTYGLRNSLHVAFMPTVSTSQIMGNNESFEPYPGNIYTKTTIAGKFMVSNNHMIRHLIELGVWNEDVKNRILNSNGSVMDIDEIPADVKEIYKTVWEIKQSELMRRTALRGAFVDQS
jgi:ribonucleoside-diphosphate reductase alpha chain